MWAMAWTAVFGLVPVHTCWLYETARQRAENPEGPLQSVLVAPALSRWFLQASLFQVSYEVSKVFSLKRPCIVRCT